METLRGEVVTKPENQRCRGRGIQPQSRLSPVFASTQTQRRLVGALDLGLSPHKDWGLGVKGFRLASVESCDCVFLTTCFKPIEVDMEWKCYESSVVQFQPPPSALSPLLSPSFFFICARARVCVCVCVCVGCCCRSSRVALGAVLLLLLCC